jgi:16S rRNA (uracil1498-N3)-methyltransferase
LTLAVSFPKGPRQDTLVEKCTELGVAELWPMHCRRSIAEPSPHRLEKLRRTVIEACKQSQRAWLCELREPASFAEVVGSVSEFDTAVIADGSADRSNAGEATSHKRVLALVGPEGGFAAEELQAARDAGCTELRLGRTILRTETAAIATAARVLAC